MTNDWGSEIQIDTGAPKHVHLDNQIYENNNLMPTETPSEQLERTLELPMADLIASCDPELNFPKCLAGRYREDLFFKRILDSPKQFTEFLAENHLVFRQEGESRTLCIPNIKIQNKNAREVIIDHAHSILAHLGPRKTLSYL